MCTAVEYRKNKIYFGRNLDYDFSYGEEVVIIPRNYKFNFKNLGKIENHFGIIGTALGYKIGLCCKCHGNGFFLVAISQPFNCHFYFIP